jgi:glycosyltransferase involved in cell wall biosynthesis
MGPDIRGVADQPVSSRPIAYVMEQTLGNVTHYLNLRHARPAGNPDLRWLPIEYRSGRLPWTIAAGRLTRRALLPVLDDVAGVFLHTMALAPGVFDLFHKKPIVISGDATPFAKREMRTAYGLGRQFRLVELAKREFFRHMFKRSAGFVAWSCWAKESLVRDYGCREDAVAVIPPGINLELFMPGDRDHELPRILFVGGDFDRKGGNLLLRVFRKHFRGRAELVIATREAVEDEPGVTVHRNIPANSDEMRRLYATSDVFALPTQADCYSIVCMEALAAGMPVVTTRVGGIPEIVLEGKTGHAVEVNDEAAFTSSLRSLVEDAAKRREMSLAARADAIARFGADDNAQALFAFVQSRC